MEETTLLDIAPDNPSGWAVIAKTIIGFVMGAIISAMIFIIMTLLGKDLFLGGVSIIVPIILALVAFVGTFIGNSAIGWAYNLFYSYKYYDFGKMFSFILIANSVLLLLITPIYFIMGAWGDAPFLVLAFHILFSIFVTQTLIEGFANPNYSGSALIGTLIAFAISVIIYLLVYQITYTNPDKLLFLVTTPAVVGYTLLPLFHSMWEKIYYKFYEVGNNFLYIPTQSEVTVKEDDMEANTQEEDDITVEM